MSPWLSDLLLRTQTDERLVALARLGQQRAFEAIVERYRQPLQAYARRISSARADDLVQQTFLSALSALQAGTEVRHLRGWLHEILRHVAWGDSRSSVMLDELQDGQALDESAQQVAERRMLAVDALVAVAQLPQSQHEAFIQTALQGRSRSEVAELMGLSEGAVRQLVHRARATIRAAVTAITPFPLVRWMSSARSSSAASLSEATVGAGTASGAGIAMSGGGIAVKLGVGALIFSGVAVTGVISAVSPHHPISRPAGRPLASRDAAAVSASGATGTGKGMTLRSTRAAGARSGRSSRGAPLSSSRGHLIQFGRRGSTSGQGAGGSGSPQGGRQGAGGSGPASSASGASDGGGGSDSSRTSGPGDGSSGSQGSDGGDSKPTAVVSADGGSSGSDGGRSGATISSSGDGGSSGGSSGSSGDGGSGGGIAGSGGSDGGSSGGSDGSGSTTQTTSPWTTGSGSDSSGSSSSSASGDGSGSSNLSGRG